jgi:hypothetical protein
MKELETQGTISYDKNLEEVTVRKRRRKIMGPFSAVSKLSTLNNNLGDDIFDRLAKVSKGAMVLFTEMKKRRSEATNFVPYDTREFSKTAKETFSRQLKELRVQGLVRKTYKTMVAADPQRPYLFQQQTYMINPELLKCWEYEDAAILWEECQK